MDTPPLPEGYSLETGQASVDIDAVWRFLRDSYWARGVTREVVTNAVAGSICFSVFDQHGAQVGFARAVTDRATFAYVSDVFVLPAHAGQGIAQSMLRAMHAHPELQGLRQWLLGTADAHSLYAKLGYEAAPAGRFMQIHAPYV